MKFTNLDISNKKFKKKIELKITKVIKKSDFILGSEVKILEKRLCRYTGAKFCATVGNGTDGLLIALKIANIKKQDEVIVPNFSYISPAEVVKQIGAKLIFVDVNYDDFTINIESLKKNITKNTRAIIAVSLFGQCPDFDKIINLCKKKKITIIEDAAQSFGAKYKKKFSCSIADISVTSFFPTKPLGCYGDGGAIFVNKKKYYEKICSLRNHGQKKKYFHELVGYNSRLDNIQAAILNAKIPYLKKEINLRKKNFLYYYKKLINIPNIILPKINKYNSSSFAQFTIKTISRNKIINSFNKKSIPNIIFYPKLISEQKAYKQKAFTPIAKKLCKEVLSIPFGPRITQKEMDKVIGQIRYAFR